MDNDAATMEPPSAQKVFDDITGAYAQMDDGQKEKFNDIVAQGQDEPQAAEAQLQTYMDGLPNHIRDQLQRGLVGAEQLTPEQLRDLSRIAAIDGDVAGLAFASGRGDTSSNPGDWQQVVGSGQQGVETSQGETLSPPAGIPDMNDQGKGGPDL